MCCNLGDWLFVYKEDILSVPFLPGITGINVQFNRTKMLLVIIIIASFLILDGSETQ